MNDRSEKGARSEGPGNDVVRPSQQCVMSVVWTPILITVGDWGVWASAVTNHKATEALAVDWRQKDQLVARQKLTCIIVPFHSNGEEVS